MKLAPVMESMPEVNNEVLRWEAELEHRQYGLLKPLAFAKAFEVSYTPETHGEWEQSDDGWWIWRMNIRSSGALSLNLIFEDFSLPEKALLYIFTHDYQYIKGAYTRKNNAPAGIFATAPLPGDEITVQYEIPYAPAGRRDFTISRVNHDFLGILKYTDKRRPRYMTAESCILDVRCPAGQRWEEVRNSVCRVMVLGRELCTGTLLNNTAQNQKPYIITANHCLSTAEQASGTLFLFNYESPYCGPLDGDVTNSLSGSILKSTLDTLDFTLLEMTTPPPPAFRPYYAGWNRNTAPSDTSACLQHPQGDIKKIAVDDHSPAVSSFYSTFLKNGFWKIGRWETGSTEIGSSGGPLFTKNSLLIGSLSGGVASCIDPVNDYFVRFDLAWNYKADSSKQLKYWLDPLNSNPMTMDGKQFNSGENLCGTFTNLTGGDTHTLLKYREKNGQPGGYWSGTNSGGITEIAEKFRLNGNEMLSGISLGIAKKQQLNPENKSALIVKVYRLKESNIIQMAAGDTVFIKNLVPDAMNYVKFRQVIEASDSIFVSVNFENIKAGDSIAIYQSLRSAPAVNTFFIRKGGQWSGFMENTPEKYSASLAFELMACNVNNPDSLPVKNDSTIQLDIYPNPAITEIMVRSNQPLEEEMVSVFDITGKKLSCRVTDTGPGQVAVNLKGNPPGFYILRVVSGNFQSRKKFLLIPR